MEGRRPHMPGRGATVRTVARWMVLGALACAGGEEPGSVDTVASVQIIPYRPWLLQGQTQRLTAVVLDTTGHQRDDLPVTWSSSDSAVVTVAPNGQIQAVGAGFVVVSASSGGMTAIDTVIVWRHLAQIEQNGVPDSFPTDLAIDPRNDSVLYAAAVTGMYRSADRGASWSQRLQAPHGDAQGHLAIAPDDPDRLYYAAWDSLYLSVDGGRQWSPLLALDSQYVVALETSRFDPATVYATVQRYLHDDTTHSGGIYRSIDRGAHWSFHTFPGGTGSVDVIPYEPAEDPQDGTLYTSLEIADHSGNPYRPPVFRSDNRGDSWTDITGIVNWHAQALAVDPLTHEVFVATEGAGLFRSTDRGANWVQAFAPVSAALRQDPVRRAWFYSADYDDGVSMSLDAAANFQRLGLDPWTCRRLTVTGTGTRLYAVCILGGIFELPLPAAAGARIAADAPPPPQAIAPARGPRGRSSPRQRAGQSA